VTVTKYVNTAGTVGTQDGSTVTSGNSGTAAFATMDQFIDWLVANDATISDSYICECSGSAADTVAVAVTGLTVASSRTITIRGNRGESDGFYDGDALISTSHYRLAITTSSNCITVSENDLTIDGIQFNHTPGDSFRSCVTPSTNVNGLIVQKCRFRNAGNSRSAIGNNGSAGSYGSSPTVTYRNNLSVAFNSPDVDIFVSNFNTPTINLYNNTFYRGASGNAIKVDTNGGSGAAVANIKNNICANTGAAPFSVAGNWTANYDTNGTDTGAIGTTNEVDLQPGSDDLDDLFTARGTGTGADFTLINGGAAHDAGISSGMPTDDIRDEARTGSYDLGCFEIQAAGGSPYTLTGDAGSYTLTGIAAGLKAGRKLAGAAGSYAITGQDATLTYTPDSGSPFTLVADAGSYTLTGVAAGLRATRRLTGAAGSYTLTGQAATFGTRAYRLVAAAGSYTMTGVAATLSTTGSELIWTPVTPAGGTWTPETPAGGTWTPQ
jgi:hypothetical protein